MRKKFNIDGIKRMITTETEAREKFWSPTNLPSKEGDDNYLSDENKAPRKISKKDLTLPRLPTKISRVMSSTVSSLVINDIIMSLKYNAMKSGIYIIANNPEKADIILESMLESISCHMDIYKIEPLNTSFRKFFDKVPLLQNKDNMKSSIIFVNAIALSKDDLKWLISSISANIRHIIDKKIHLLIWATDEQLAQIQLQTDKLTESIINFYRFGLPLNVVEQEVKEKPVIAEHPISVPQTLEQIDVLLPYKTKKTDLSPSPIPSETTVDTTKKPQITPLSSDIKELKIQADEIQVDLEPQPAETKIITLLLEKPSKQTEITHPVSDEQEIQKNKEKILEHTVIQKFNGWLMPIVKEFIRWLISLIKQFTAWLIPIVLKVCFYALQHFIRGAKLIIMWLAALLRQSVARAKLLFANSKKKN
ncbi:MAG: hypothetical protein HZB80_00555 [Deltaproteobacteria bacterium]|nr:hypothetical protein [Deltaproteobacteria bacterium]